MRSISIKSITSATCWTHNCEAGTDKSSTNFDSSNNITANSTTKKDDGQLQNNVATTKPANNGGFSQAPVQQRMVVAPARNQENEANRNDDTRDALNLLSFVYEQQSAVDRPVHQGGSSFKEIGTPITPGSSAITPNNTASPSTPSYKIPPVPRSASAVCKNQKKRSLETIVNGLADKVGEPSSKSKSSLSQSIYCELPASETSSPNQGDPTSSERTPRGRKPADVQQKGPQLRSRRK
ncbi:unnamed protein product [Caenorhabditis brenneri]